MKWTYFLFLLLFACQSNSGELADSPEDEVELKSTEPIIPIKSIPAISELTLTVDNLKLRAKPGSDGKELMRLPEKSVVVPTGEKTDLKQQVSLRGLSYNEPWLEVQVNDNVKGWIYAGASDLNPEASELSAALFDSRTDRFFGSASFELEEYRRSFNEIKSAKDLKDVFEAGLALQTEATRNFAKKCRIAEMPMDLELSWVKHAYPGYAMTRVAEATEIAFLPNLNDFLEQAAKTPKEDDDKALAFLKTLNGNYSVLLFFRDWYQQTTDFGGVSLLGIGKHLEYLTQAEEMFKADNLFIDGIIKRECNLILDDIVNNEVGYARDQASILKEIDQIIAADFSLLTPEQKAAIESRKKEFDNPTANKIRVNEKVGVY